MTLTERWDTLRKDQPKIRIRDAATQLGVSEVELLATTDAVRLDTDHTGLVHALVEVGRCMGLTRNDSCVIEVTGTYGNVQIGPHAGQVIGDGIDLRVFMQAWAIAYAVTEPHDGGVRRSIHAFDKHGTAVHKVYLQAEGGNAAAWDAIVAARTRADLPLVLEPAVAAPVARPDDEVDRTALVTAWDGMQDTHEFFHLMRAYRVTRTQALRLAGDERAHRVRREATSLVLHDAAETGERIMIFVGNKGCIQIFSGSVKKILAAGPWLNVMDPGFNLHLRDDKVAEAWVVHKPTRTGIVSSLELYDEHGETIALIFRKRDDREQAEDPAWRALLARLPVA